MTGSPVDQAFPPEPLGGDEPGRDGPDGRVDRRGGDGDVVGGAQLGIEVEAELGGHHPHRLPEAGAEGVGHDAGAGLLWRGAEQHPVADDVGSAVRADVGELLGPDVAHRADSAEIISGNRSVMPPGWMPVPCSVTPAARHTASNARPLVVGRVEPAERGHDVLARLEDAGDDRRVGEQRAVDHAVGVDGEQRLDVGGGGDADRVAADQRADVDAVLVGRVHPAPDQLEVGVIEHALDGGPAHPARRPLDHSKRGHIAPPRFANDLCLKHVLAVDDVDASARRRDPGVRVEGSLSRLPARGLAGG